MRTWFVSFLFFFLGCFWIVLATNRTSENQLQNVVHDFGIKMVHMEQAYFIYSIPIRNGKLLNTSVGSKGLPHTFSTSRWWLKQPPIWKNISQNGFHLPPIFGVNIKNRWVATTWATKKKPTTFHYTGWLTGILIMVYYNPNNNWVVVHPLHNLTNQGPFFIAHLVFGLLACHL